MKETNCCCAKTGSQFCHHCQIHGSFPVLQEKGDKATTNREFLAGIEEDDCFCEDKGGCKYHAEKEYSNHLKDCTLADEHPGKCNGKLPEPNHIDTVIEEFYTKFVRKWEDKEGHECSQVEAAPIQIKKWLREKLEEAIKQPKPQQ